MIHFCKSRKMNRIHVKNNKHMEHIEHNMHMIHMNNEKYMFNIQIKYDM